MLARILTEKLFKPVSDNQLRVIFYSTCLIAFITVLVMSGVLGDSKVGLVREILLASTGILVCVTLCKTLFHDEVPEVYIRYGSYVMALTYSLVVINELIVKIQSMVPSTV